MIERQKAESGRALVSTVLFDDQSEVIHDRIDIRRVPPMTEGSRRWKTRKMPLYPYKSLRAVAGISAQRRASGHKNGSKRAGHANDGLFRYIAANRSRLTSLPKART